MKFNIPKNTTTISMNTGEFLIKISLSKTFEAGVDWNISFSYLFLFEFLSQTCHFTERFSSSGTKISSNDRNRMAKSWCSTESWLDTLYASCAWTTCFVVSTTVATTTKVTIDRINIIVNSFIVCVDRFYGLTTSYEYFVILFPYATI